MFLSSAARYTPRRISDGIPVDVYVGTLNLIASIPDPSILTLPSAKEN